MDTDAIYLEVCNYGRSCRARNVMDEADHMQMIVSLLRNADEEHKSLLATNEKLVDEVNELKAKLTEKASLLRGCYARIDKLEKALRELHDATQLVSVGNYDQEAHDIAVSRAREALEKRP